MEKFDNLFCFINRKLLNSADREFIKNYESNFDKSVNYLCKLSKNDSIQSLDKNLKKMQKIVKCCRKISLYRRRAAQIRGMFYTIDGFGTLLDKLLLLREDGKIGGIYVPVQSLGQTIVLKVIEEPDTMFLLLQNIHNLEICAKIRNDVVVFRKTDQLDYKFTLDNLQYLTTNGLTGFQTLGRTNRMCCFCMKDCCNHFELYLSEDS